ncbi:Flavodoxin reductase (ferredoxin-NADPH reductase) family 1 [Hoeflea phototrophica DFL-43]|uniref:Flavodoxin reductase (Ferredoxin-NADPH reductase) family 1 n=1 Tax=Hoeflea phototrophica (strain DSM 17068 / NCIMB 14078 / DFL-43) TaxID=411684 RepID=A9DGL1_HOEPD|nr:2Fe-2S iron-sulfur cluster-binding protein [Hoeflea phototrophica]EDQ31643.1 Flavodoxin reductase (ferredoxin-NADPH reductase) family 1 [Hoeflea phototrophica DFL-43]
MAAPRFHTLEIAAVRNETPDAVAISFAIPEDLSGTFAFVPGQYLTLRAEIGGEDMRRSYSICSPLSEKDRRTVGVKRIEDGRFSSFAQTLKAGDRIQVMPPQGRFTAQIGGDHDYLLLAAGSGITPCLSIAKSVLAGEPDSTVTLLYANRNSSSVMFRDDLNDLKDRYTTRFTLLHVMDEEVQDVEIMNGRLDAEKLETLAGLGVIDPKSADAIYICGPEPMIRSASTALATLCVDADRIKFELFTPAPGAKPAPAKTNGTAVNGGSPSTTGHGASVEIILDGARRTIEVDAGQDTVLTAAQKAGLDLPFSCAGGMCCTCRCRIVEGAATMDENFSLEPWEIEAGFTLSCQARPDTGKLVLDFDAQ